MKNSGPAVYPNQALLATALLVLLAWPAWLRGGTVPRFMEALPAVAILLLAACLVAGPTRAVCGRLLKDPVFYSLLLFLGLLGLQAWNAGRELIFDGRLGAWAYTPPPHPGWPFAFTRPEALEMLYWFVPAAVVVWLARSGLAPRTVRRLFDLLLVSGGLLAAAGIAQHLQGTPFLPGTGTLERNYFAGFGYRNHAGAFFLLVYVVGLARLLEPRPRAAGRARAGVLRVFLALLALVAVHLSLSRAAMAGAWVMTLVFLLAFYPLHVRRAPRSTRFHLLLAAAGALGAAGFLVSGFGRRLVERELTTLTPARVFHSLTSGRFYQVEAALDIWKEHPWFGTGGWGYRYLVGLVLTPEEWAARTAGGEDLVITANVHHDAVQFLCEFGLAGFGLLLFTVLVMAAPLARRRLFRRPLPLLVTTGLLLTLLHSLIDLPFRCPAVLYLWLFLLAGAATLVKEERRGYGKRLSTPPP